MLEVTANTIVGCAKDTNIIICIVVVLWCENGDIVGTVTVALQCRLAPGQHNNTVKVVRYPLQRVNKRPLLEWIVLHLTKLSGNVETVSNVFP